MMKYFLIKNQDGTVQFMQMLRQPPEYLDSSYSTPDAEIAKWAPHKQKEVESWREIDLEHLPKDRTFRDAWRDSGKAVDIDMPKARDIHRNTLRALREPKLKELDIEYQKADETGDGAKKKEIAARKQALRDVTASPAIEKAATPEELMAAIPDVLK